MKKILSVLLAVMMIFGTLSIGASAAPDAVTDEYHASGLVKDNQIIVLFDLNGGTMATAQIFYDKQAGWTYKEGITGLYYRLPREANAQVPGTSIPLPDVTAPSGLKFSGWEFVDENNNQYVLGAGSPFYFEEWMLTGTNDTYGVVYLKARFTSAEAESDTLATVLGILTKVFGAIIGIVLYGGDTEAGVALMNKVLGGLLN